MVGDEDQSIYRFRAAYPRALLDFTDTYTNPYIMFLETNYRSTKQIVSAAQKFISQNINRHSEKHMQASRGDGKPIERITVEKKHEQYSAVCDIANGEHGQLAVLYRNNIYPSERCRRKLFHKQSGTGYSLFFEICS